MEARCCQAAEQENPEFPAKPRTPARPPPQTELSGTADLVDVDHADPPSPEW
jgi:hypothetical protein